MSNPTNYVDDEDVNDIGFGRGVDVDVFDSDGLVQEPVDNRTLSMGDVAHCRVVPTVLIIHNLRSEEVVEGGLQLSQVRNCGVDHIHGWFMVRTLHHLQIGCSRY